MSIIEQADVIRCTVSLRNPFEVEALPFLARLHEIAFRPRRRVAKRFIGKPAKRLFRLLLALGVEGTGRLRVATPSGPRKITFRARNTQFGALYMPQDKPVYEPETSALLDRLVGDEDVFFDIGANWGWYAVLIATRPTFHGAVHAFEPFPSTFADLASVVRQAGLEARITCHDVALGARDGQGEMAFSDGVQSGLARLGEKGGVAVRLARLDDLSLSLAPPCVIKIDAEDHELEVLEGATATIDQARPFIVFENWLHHHEPRLTLAPIALLAARRYRFFFVGWVRQEADCILHDPGPSTELALVPFIAAQRFQLPTQMNIVAVPIERMDEFRQRLTRA